MAHVSLEHDVVGVSMDMQWIGVMAITGAAVVYLWRRYRRVQQGLAPMCGNCDNCSCDSKGR
ncbi:MAG: hypothetical protein RL357_821 [Pseudomonadota bacterium]